MTDEGLLITLAGALENGKDFCASQSLRDSSPRTEATKRRWKDGSWIKNKTERASTLSVLWSECNYRIWKNPVISMVLAHQARGFYPNFFSMRLESYDKRFFQMM